MYQTEKQNEQAGVSSPVKRGSQKVKTTTARSIERTEYDDMIKSLQGCQMLDNEL